MATARYWIATERYREVLQPDYLITGDGTVVHSGERLVCECGFSRAETDQVIGMIQEAVPEAEIVSAANRTVYWNSLHIDFRKSDKGYKKMNKAEFQKIENYMRECMSDSAHDCEHIFRVLYVALDIASRERDVDYDLLITASLLHDIGRKEQFENPKLCHAQVGAEKARKFLRENGYKEVFAEKVANCIRAHRYRSSNPPRTIEEKILFDADKIDATGTMGIARTLLYKAKVDEPLYSLDENGLVSDGSNDTEPSFFQEYKYKLEGLYDKFFTARGQEIALERQQSAVSFYENMLREVQDSYKTGRTLLEDLCGEAERPKHIAPILEKMGDFFDVRLNGYE